MFLPILDGIAGFGQYSKMITICNSNSPEVIFDFPAISNNKAILLTALNLYYMNVNIRKIYVYLNDKDDNHLLCIAWVSYPEMEKLYYYYPNILLLPGNYIRIKIEWTTGEIYVVCSIAGLEFDYGGD